MLGSHITEQINKKKNLRTINISNFLFFKYEKFLFKINTTKNSVRPMLSSTELLDWKEPLDTLTSKSFLQVKKSKLNYIL